MLNGLHLPHLRQVRRWPTLGARATIAMSLVLFALVFVLRISDPNTDNGEGVLFLAPIGVLALRFGLRGAFAGAAGAFALLIAWGKLDDNVDLGLTWYLVRAATLIAVTGLAPAWITRFIAFSWASTLRSPQQSSTT